MRTLITHIGWLAGIQPRERLRLEGKDMASTGCMKDAFLLIENGRIADFGLMESLTERMKNDRQRWEKVQVEDAEGGCVLPAWCDPHTHLVYAGSREGEFVDKIRGLSYLEIAKRGGGILHSADRLHEMTEDQLYEVSMRRLEAVAATGTGCVEIKSGYGLNTEDELKMLRVIRRMKDASPLTIRATFLGAHAVGRAFTGRREAYVRLVIEEMLPAVAAEKLADFVDVFCDKGFFTPEETAAILKAAEKYGMRPKIHGCELASSGGVKVAVAHHALSVDHLESADEKDLEMLKGTDTMPTLLPGTSFFLNMPYARGRDMIDKGLGIALATDCNPGSTPSADMRFVVSLACIKMRLLPVEAFNAATINAAYAMGLSHDYGSIAIGKRACLQMTVPIPSLDYIPYAYTRNLVKKMYY